MKGLCLGIVATGEFLGGGGGRGGDAGEGGERRLGGPKQTPLSLMGGEYSMHLQLGATGPVGRLVG